MGGDALSFISYSADGYVFVHIIANNQPANATNDLMGGTLAKDSLSVTDARLLSGSQQRYGLRSFP
jgi:hypothetical protein